MSAERLGPFLLRQPPGVFPLGEDALRLAAFATVRRSWKVCDLGTGSCRLPSWARRRDIDLLLKGH